MEIFCSKNATRTITLIVSNLKFIMRYYIFRSQKIIFKIIDFVVIGDKSESLDNKYLLMIPLVVVYKSCIKNIHTSTQKIYVEINLKF